MKFMRMMLMRMMLMMYDEDYVGRGRCMVRMMMIRIK